MGLEADVLGYIRSQFAPQAGGELDVHTDLLEDGILDSTAMMQLVLWIEETYQFPVELEDIAPETFGTVQRLAKYVQTRRSGRQEG